MYYEMALNFVGNTVLQFSELCSFNPNISFLTLGVILILFSWVLAFLGKR